MRIAIAAHKIDFNADVHISSGGWIDLGNRPVGSIIHSVVALTPAKVYALFDDKLLVQYLTKLKLPSKFTYVWVDEIVIDAKYRGKGLARRVFDKLSAKTPCLLALNVGSVSGTRIPEATRTAIYTKMGFTLVKDSRKYVYAFKFVS